MERIDTHLQSVNESYFEHMWHALSFTVTLAYGAVCCLIHAFVPSLCETKGSAVVQRLHERMVVNRRKRDESAPTMEGSVGNN